MNKVEFIAQVAGRTGTSKQDTKVLVEAVLDTITETLAKKEQIQFIGFGTFKTSERAARTATVPGTDRKVEVAATTAPVFKAGKDLKQKVSGK